MRIGIVIPTLTAGGAERVASILASMWASEGNHVVYLYLLSAADDFYEVDPRVIVRKLGLAARLRGFSRLFGIISVGRLLRAEIKRDRLDVVLSFMNKYNIFTLFSTFSLNISIVVSERDSPTEKLPLLTRLLRKISYKWAAGIIAQTEEGREFIVRETGNHQVVAIPNPLRTFWLDRDSSLKRERMIINVGRLVHKKGQSQLIRTFARMGFDDWRLVLVGDGEERENLVALTEKLEIQGQVQFVGEVLEVDQWLSRASIFAFTSLYEGFPNALAEAMSAGVPVVSYDCPTGPAELIQDGVNGFLVQLHDEDSLQARLEELMTNAELRLRFSKAAVESTKHLDAAQIANQYLQFLQRASRYTA